MYELQGSRISRSRFSASDHNHDLHVVLRFRLSLPYYYTYETFLVIREALVIGRKACRSMQKTDLSI